MPIFEQLSTMGHEQVVYCSDITTGLKAIIAIHDTTLGPALGGCRMWNYSSDEEALTDVLRLSRGMTYKAAVSGLNLGGGKAVIIGDPEKLKSEALFRTFGRFIKSLNGRYITAEDVNIRVQDMEQVALETDYVTGISSRIGGSGDPSPITALGVFYGIKASVFHKLRKHSLNGLSISIQGCGSVGTYLCQLLKNEGAKLFAADLSPDNLDYVVKEFGAEAVDIDQIHALPVEVFAPCALGGILNPQTIPDIKAPIIAGGANNQLLDEDRDGEMVKQREILYAPDYVINAGGLINVYQELQGYDRKAAEGKVKNIYDILLQIYQEAERSQMTTNMASARLAENRIAGVRGMTSLNQTMTNQLWVSNSKNRQ